MFDDSGSNPRAEFPAETGMNRRAWVGRGRVAHGDGGVCSSHDGVLGRERCYDEPGHESDAA